MVIHGNPSCTPHPDGLSWGIIVESMFLLYFSNVILTVLWVQLLYLLTSVNLSDFGWISPFLEICYIWISCFKSEVDCKCAALQEGGTRDSGCKWGPKSICFIGLPVGARFTVFGHFLGYVGVACCTSQIFPVVVNPAPLASPSKVK